MINTKAIEEHVRGILRALGDDPGREGLRETPQRVAAMYEEVFAGMKYTNEEIGNMFRKTFADGRVSDMADAGRVVVMKDIDMFSFCEHHMALMYDMKATVAYIPAERVLGLSKIARICDIMSAVTGSDDVAVVLTAAHSCVTARGVKNRNTRTRTVELRGRFKDEAALQLYLQ